MLLQLLLSLVLVAAAVVYLAWRVVQLFSGRWSSCDGCASTPCRPGATARDDRAERPVATPLGRLPRH